MGLAVGERPPVQSIDFTPAQVHEILVDYLLMKVAVRDWHGVADAAIDLRELEAKHPELRR